MYSTNDRTSYPAPESNLHRMTMTFTPKGMQTLRAYREFVAANTGRRPSLGAALDALLLSHSFGQTSGDSRLPSDSVTSRDAPCYLHLRPRA